MCSKKEADACAVGSETAGVAAALGGGGVGFSASAPASVSAPASSGSSAVAVPPKASNVGRVANATSRR